MQIPPATALLNLLAALPAQGISAAPAAAKGSQPTATPQQAPAASPAASVASGQPPSGILPRGSIVNILA